MRSGACLVPVCLLLLALNACATMSDYNPVGCIYDATTDQRAMVFNFRTHWMSFQDKRSANVESSSEFAGYFNDCTDSSYYCLSGPLSIAVPVTIKGHEWKHDGMSCKARMLTAANSYEISCEDSDGRETSVNYSPLNGILVIRQVEGGSETDFLLRGNCGIFCGQRRERGRGDESPKKRDGGN